MPSPDYPVQRCYSILNILIRQKDDGRTVVNYNRNRCAFGTLTIVNYQFSIDVGSCLTNFTVSPLLILLPRMTFARATLSPINPITITRAFG